MTVKLEVSNNTPVCTAYDGANPVYLIACADSDGLTVATEDASNIKEFGVACLEEECNTPVFTSVI